MFRLAKLQTSRWNFQEKFQFGEQKTPSPFVSTCDKYIYTEVLRAKSEENEAIVKKTSNELKQDTKLVSLLRNAVESSSDESGWAHLGSVGSNIAKQSPQFVPRNYGYGKLGELVAATNLFDIASAFILNSSVGRRHFVSADYHCPLYSKIWLSTSLQ